MSGKYAACKLKERLQANKELATFQRMQALCDLAEMVRMETSRFERTAWKCRERIYTPYTFNEVRIR